MPEARFTLTLAPGELRTVEVDGTEVLLAGLSDGRVTALSSHCTHWGAPLVEGLVVGDTVVCPWHRACFRLDDGACLAAPGVDDLARFAVRREGTDLVVTVPAPAPDRTLPAGQASGTGRTVVIVGLGAAGRSAADALLREDLDARLVLVSAEPHPPHDRPMLSKSYLQGKDEDYLELREADFYRARGAELHLDRRITRLDAATRTLSFEDGETLVYDVCLFAPGARPRPLDVPGGDLPGVFLLRDTPDADALKAAAEGATRAVVIGGGFIGLEAAASLRQRGLDVTVVAREDAPLARIVGPKIADRIRATHERHGVRFVLNATVEAVQGADRVQGVRLSTGAVLPADLVVAGLGVVPATDVLHGIERRGDGGLAVTETLEAAPGLFVAGDVAAYPLPDGRRVRVEHWRVASGHGRVAAANLRGTPTLYRDVPYFWSNQFDFDFELVGNPTPEAEIRYDGDVEGGAFLAWFVRAGRVEGLASAGRDREAMAVYALMRAAALPSWEAIAAGADLVAAAQALPPGTLVGGA